MSNSDRPHGLESTQLAQPYPEFIEPFVKLVGYGTAIFKNDVVYEVDGAAGSGDAPAIQAWGSATPGTTIPLGVACNYAPTLTRSTHEVITSPFTRYEAQDNSDTDGFVLADMGQRANIEANAGSTTTELSGHELDESTLHATSTRDVRLHRLLGLPDNDFGPWSRIIVSFLRTSQSIQV